MYGVVLTPICLERIAMSEWHEDFYDFDHEIFKNKLRQVFIKKSPARHGLWSFSRTPLDPPLTCREFIFCLFHISLYFFP